MWILAETGHRHLMTPLCLLQGIANTSALCCKCFSFVFWKRSTLNQTIINRGACQSLLSNCGQGVCILHSYLVKSLLKSTERTPWILCLIHVFCLSLGSWKEKGDECFQGQGQSVSRAGHPTLLDLTVFRHPIPYCRVRLLYSQHYQGNTCLRRKADA